MPQRANTQRRFGVARPAAIDADQAWSFLLAVRSLGRRGGLPPTVFAVGDGGGGPVVLDRGDSRALVTIEPDGRWTTHVDLQDAVATLFDLYLPMALSGAERPLVLGHLGVSLDGHVATGSGESQYITGRENIVHLHRLRALADAVIVGAATVEHDDPQLTTRHVEGDSPVRVVIDPGCRLGRGFRVFRDGAAETVLFCAEDPAKPANARHGAARVYGIPAGPNGLSLDALLARLRALGLHGVLVEGGGVTVSRFLRESQLDRLQLAVAPLITGSGRPGLSLPPLGDLAQALRPRCRHFAMGSDVLFDCDLRAEAS